MSAVSRCWFTISRTFLVAEICLLTRAQEAYFAIAGVKALVCIASHGDLQLRKEAFRLLKDKRPEVYAQGLKLLGHISEGRDAKAMKVAEDSLTHELALVRENAVRTFGKAATFGDRQAIQVLLGHTGDPDPNVREAVAEVIPQIAAVGDGVVAQLVMSQIVHRLEIKERDNERQACSLQILGAWASKGDEDVLHQVNKRIHDRSLIVRIAALKAYGEIAPADVVKPTMSIKAMTAVCEVLLQEKDSTAKEVALRTLAKVTQHGNHFALNCISSHAEECRENTKDVRAAALQALATLAEKNDEKAVGIIISAMKDTDPEVKEVAEQALKHLVDRGNDFAVSALLKNLSDGARNYEIQVAALAGLAQVANPGDPLVLKTVHSSLKSNVQSVRHAALRSLIPLTAKKDGSLTSFVAEHLTKEKNRFVKQLALNILAQLFVEIGGKYSLVIAASLPCLTDEWPTVRTAALQCLATVGHRGDKHVTRAVVAVMLDDKDLQVRLAAVKAVENVADGQDVEALEGLRACCLLEEDIDEPLQEEEGVRKEIQTAAKLALKQLEALPVRPKREFPACCVLS
eukprot:TRINITY_DN3417_c4_g1_i1.p1 TRINITY_DN3417_c4_g1~~TRINITY_DN3417_c4_g1_i1.p1  ORF type:complete len:656 (+),score=144.94 TRINITY_DN3417_c4_g1_i1:252-1970(+)